MADGMSEELSPPHHITAAAAFVNVLNIISIAIVT